MAAPIRQWTRGAASVALVVTLGACAASAPPSGSPSAAVAPAASQGPAASPTPSPSPTIPAPSEAPAYSDVPVEGTGEFYALDCSLAGPCLAEYLPDPVGDEPGWPVVVSGPCRGTAKAPDGSAYAACDIRDAVLVHRFDADGRPVAGWPVRLPGSGASVYANLFTIGCGSAASSLRLTSHGDVVVATVDRDAALLHVHDRDGNPRPGWPRPFPGDAPGNDGIGGNGCRGFEVGSDGAVLAWGYEGVAQDIDLVANRTEFLVYEADGRTRSGWPRGSTGAASRAIFADDGSVAYVSASGKVWRHDADGSIDDGWPYQLPNKAGPYLAPDGRIIVIAGDGGSHTALSLAPSGEVTKGWPVPLGIVETRCLFGDTPCSGSVPPVIANDGTLHVALSDGTVTAIDAEGDVLPGWPVELGRAVHAIDLTVDEGDRIVVRAVACSEDDPPCMGDVESMTLTVERDGSMTTEPAP